ncbi:calcium-binding protein [Aliiroseovarius sp. F20344]|uniref:calcium-binding protein n=1 Tax=Aliiroseovarius sp. F20344 TaxID=2926414 RepID=UPI001FF4D0D2|nr:calcium-binding protein [Aliiroseovarius sp. F20344]MCK0142129.1 hypothetical protein [Aliiroseovarius sp. F20344]
MNDFQLFEGNTLQSTSSKIVTKQGGQKLVYTGTFDYDLRGDVDGRLKTMTHSVKGTAQYTITDMDAEVDRFFNYITGFELGVDDRALTYLFRKADVFQGSSGNDVLKSYGGSDVVNAGSGNDRANGGSGNDILRGGAGRDTLIGQSGRDTLNGGFGKDVLIGGKDGDVFVFFDNSGIDRIRDFNAKSDSEDIDLSNVSAIKNWKDLKNNHMSTQNGDVVIEYGKNKIIIEDTKMKHLDADDFLF